MQTLKTTTPSTMNTTKKKTHGSPLDLQDNPITFIAAGCLHTAAVTAHGWLFTWGEGKSGNLGHGDGKPRPVPTLVPGQLIWRC
jgi:alpha-tubulin suppressor-like RCC1 family protein